MSPCPPNMKVGLAQEEIARRGWTALRGRGARPPGEARHRAHRSARALRTRAARPPSRARCTCPTRRCRRAFRSGGMLHELGKSTRQAAPVLLRLRRALRPWRCRRRRTRALTAACPHRGRPRRLEESQRAAGAPDRGTAWAARLRPTSLHFRLRHDPNVGLRRLPALRVGLLWRPRRIPRPRDNDILAPASSSPASRLLCFAVICSESMTRTHLIEVTAGGHRIDQNEASLSCPGQ